MNTIDRLLQNHRIVTKVFLFIVPLIGLVAVVGGSGYFTAAVLNGHMGIARASIEAIGDFQDLTARLQAFTAAPTQETRAGLQASIDAQSAGVQALDALLVGAEDKRQIAPIVGLAAEMAGATAQLWTLHEAQVRNRAEIGGALEAIVGRAVEARKQFDNLQLAYDSKERFAKGALFDAYGFRAIAQRLQTLREAIQSETDDDGAIMASQTFGAMLKQEFGKVSGRLSGSASLAKLKPIQSAMDELAAIAAGSAGAAEKARAIRALSGRLAVFQEGLQAETMAMASDAAAVFVEIDGEITALKSGVRQVGMALEAIEALRLKMGSFLIQPTAGALEALLIDIDGLRASGAAVAALSPATRDFGQKLAPLLDSLGNAARAAAASAQDWQAARTMVADGLAGAMTALKVFVAEAQATGKRDSDRFAQLSVIAMIAGTVLAIADGLMLVAILRIPFRRVTSIMKRLTAGDLDVQIGGQGRRDEIGDMLRSITLFQNAALANIRLEQEAATERQRIAGEQGQALSALSDVLGALASGNLERRLDHGLPDNFIDMVRTYNQAVDTLRATLAEVRLTADGIDDGTGKLAAAADDLARRTEQQVTALEQSSQALGQLSNIVRMTADSARQTSLSMNETEEFAVRSGDVVARAIATMGEISRSSEEIAAIVGMIDQIAFQTNLLALNASIEAASAGVAGRGFAVVAQEVRDLARRSAGAAQQIKTLISASSAHVLDGVRFVEETGDALSEIIAHVSNVRALVAQISAAAGDQSDGILGVMRAVHDAEAITQRNAAIVVENNTEIHHLRHRAEFLAKKIETFKVGVAAGA